MRAAMAAPSPPTIRELARKVRLVRDHGQSRKYFHDFEGYNGRLDSIQAGILSVKLKHLEASNKSRRVLAERYAALLANVPGIVLPYEPSWSRAVYHLYVIRVSRGAARCKSTSPILESAPGSTIRSPCTSRRHTLIAGTGRATCQVCQKAASGDPFIADVSAAGFPGPGRSRGETSGSVQWIVVESARPLGSCTGAR